MSRHWPARCRLSARKQTRGQAQWNGGFRRSAPLPISPVQKPGLIRVLKRLRRPDLVPDEPSCRTRPQLRPYKWGGPADEVGAGAQQIAAFSQRHQPRQGRADIEAFAPAALSLDQVMAVKEQVEIALCAVWSGLGNTGTSAEVFGGYDIFSPFRRAEQQTMLAGDVKIARGQPPSEGACGDPDGIELRLIVKRAL